VSGVANVSSTTPATTVAGGTPSRTDGASKPPAAAGGGAGFERMKSTFAKHSEVPIVLGVVFVVGLLVLPLPAIFLDLLLTASIAASLIVLLVAIYIDRPLDFSAFPSVLLLLTLYRLALNVSSTRLILGKGEGGAIIESFGEFVIGGNYAVGVVIFLILVGINFIVITKGAGRVAEVAARFTLDAMPGRQMSIDGDLSAGLIDDAEAKRRREEVSREADFYGAMDGSAKFVRGDAIAGLLITGINIVGGFFIGVVQRGWPVGRALSEYTILTVGDGLVSQIPALIISTAAGIMVTSSSGGDRMAEAVMRQVGRTSKPIWIAAGFLAALALVPALPTLPFLALAGATAGLARLTARREAAEAARAAVAERAPAERSETEERRDPVHDLLQIDPVELEIGYALIPLVDGEGGDLLDRIKLLRKQAAQDLGFLVPAIRIRDDVRLGATEYLVRIRGTEVARGEVMPKLLMALDTGTVVSPIEGQDAVDPSFGMPAKWIQRGGRLDAEAAGYVVVEPTTVMATHLMEALKRHAAELLGRQDVQDLVEALKETYPALVEEVIPDKVPLGLLHRVLQRLLKEGIPVRDFVTILETLADAAEHTRDPESLTEQVRRALAPVIGDLYADGDGEVRGITIGPSLEAALMSFFSPGSTSTPPKLLEPDTLTRLLAHLQKLSRPSDSEGRPIPVITPPGLRVGIRRLVEPVMPSLPVVSLAELPTQANIRSVGIWEMTDAT
jgi:flagellar biosynthesis protein FlhA